MIKILFIAFLAIALVGCAVGAPAPHAAGEKSQTSPPVQAVFSGEEIATGQQIQIENPVFPSSFNAIVGQSYLSALGQECRWLKAKGGQYDREQIAFCRTGNAEWILAPRIWSQAR